MKVVRAQEMSRIEKLAIARGYSEESFMEQAGIGIARGVHYYIESEELARDVTLLCGRGNNAGDAFVAGVHLMQKGYTVTAIEVFNAEEKSPLCLKNRKRFQEGGGKCLPYSPGICDTFEETTWLDGIFGTGFRGEMKGAPAQICEEVNQSDLPILAIDTPSGLDGNTGIACPQTLKADLTFYLGLPKTGFFIREGYDYIGELSHVDFGLPEEAIADAKPDFILFTPDTILSSPKELKRSRHKYESGTILGIAGSPEMPGAALLSSHAALRSGAGMVYLYSPKGTLSKLNNRPWELICFEGSFNAIPQKILDKATSLFVGPGLTEDKKDHHKLSDFLKNLDIPCVIDASALNMLAADDTPKLPKHSILTPHFQEMHRLLGIHERHEKDLAFLQDCQNFSIRHNSTVILKGGPSFIFSPLHLPIVMQEGCPGLAKAGTGDVLTGILAALLARGFSTDKAAIIGTYLHALAGVYATEAYTQHGTMASDVIEHIPDAYHEMIGPLRTFQEDLFSCLP